MLNKEIFKEGLQELILAFNLELSTDQIKLWYKYSKDLTDAEFLKRIENCIKTCKKRPYIADLLNPEIEERQDIEYV